MTDSDHHSPDDFAAWLRKRADENRCVAALPPEKWPHSPDLLRHLAHRFEEGAALVERMTGCLRNCSGNIYHPHMPALVESLEREIEELTGVPRP